MQSTRRPPRHDPLAHHPRHRHRRGWRHRDAHRPVLLLDVVRVARTGAAAENHVDTMQGVWGVSDASKSRLSTGDIVRDLAGLRGKVVGIEWVRPKGAPITAASTQQMVYVEWTNDQKSWIYREFLRRISPAPPRRVRHKKRGTLYDVLGEAELQTSTDLVDGSEMIVYRGDDGRLWVRPIDEFEDGRFEDVPSRECGG